MLVDFDADEVDAEAERRRRRVLPRPRNGSMATLTRLRPCSLRQYSAIRGGNVAGCGRSLSRLWIVS